MSINRNYAYCMYRLPVPGQTDLLLNEGNPIFHLLLSQQEHSLLKYVSVMALAKKMFVKYSKFNGDFTVYEVFILKFCLHQGTFHREGTSELGRYNCKYPS